MRMVRFVLLAVIATAAWAGEGDQLAGFDTPKLQAIREKLARKEALTPEEQELLQQWRQRTEEIRAKVQRGEAVAPEERQLFEMAGHGGRAPGRKGDSGPGGRPRFNIRDDARFDAAQLLCESGKPDNAVKFLEAIVQESPDEMAKSEAHLRLGDIYRDFQANPQKAMAEYTQVSGPRRGDAIRAIVSLYKGKGKSDEAVNALNKLVEDSPNKRDKVLILREMSDLYRSWGDKEKAAETLAKIADMLTYDEAKQFSEEEKSMDKPMPPVQIQRREGEGPGKKEAPPR